MSMIGDLQFENDRSAKTQPFINTSICSNTVQSVTFNYITVQQRYRCKERISKYQQT